MSPKPHVALRPGTRLWPVFELLRDRGERGATTLELSEILTAQGCPDLNISSSLGDIRKTCGQYGYTLLPALFEGKRGEGRGARKLYRYRLVKVGQEQQQPDRAAAQPVQPAMASVASVPEPERRDLFGDSRPVKPG